MATLAPAGDAGLRRLSLLAELLGAHPPALAWLELPEPARGHLDAHAWLLPRDTDARRELARLAHAVAHLRFGAPAQPRAGLRPLQQVLYGLIEDARVEHELLCELPGLLPLWAAQHGVPTDSAPSVEHLLQRLSRALLDARFDDRHPWVRASRDRVRACWHDPLAVRALASRLGNDLGQMRLGFDVRAWVVQPAYRDDHACVWSTPPEQARELEIAAAARPDPAGAEGVPGTQPRPHDVAVCMLPEWNYPLRRHRRDWCTVHEVVAAPWPGAAEPAPGCDAAARMLLRRWRHEAVARRAPPVHEGCDLQPHAVLDWWVARAVGASALPRVFRASAPAPRGGRLFVLLDASASSGAGDGGSLRFARARGTALALVRRAQALGWSCALAGFHSDTRHHVLVQRLQDFGERMPAAELAARLHGVQPRGSTRLGAALRYATRRLGAAPGPARAPRRLLLISDGCARDVDVHDPRYLRADLAQALREAARAGIVVDWFWPAGYVK